MNEILTAEGLVAYYRKIDGNWVHAVDGISLALHEGEVLGIAGESGCGKSTLASVIALTARPPLTVKAGSLVLDRQELDIVGQEELGVGFRGTLVSLLPQGAMNSLNPTQRVRDFVFDVLRSHLPEITKQEAVDRARSRIEQLSLPARILDAYPHQLSGGMKQRVVAVISTLLNPKVLIADEPTSALDVSSQRALLALLSRLLNEGIIGSIIFVTHEVAVLRHLAHRIMIMYAGQLAEIGPTEKVIFEPAHPYAQALMNATIVLETTTRHERIPGFEGAPPDLTDPPPGCRFHPRCPVSSSECSEKLPPVISTASDHRAACWWVSRNLTAAKRS